MSAGATQCNLCGLPRFHGATGYAGPQCTCHFTQYNAAKPASEEDMKIYQSIADGYSKPTPTQIQQVIEQLEREGYVLCKKEPVAELTRQGVRFHQSPIENLKLYAVAPPYAMKEPKGVPLEDVIAEMESTPEGKQAMDEGRQWVKETFYGEKEGEGKCSDHPDAPHGFNRNASHNAGRYVCDCEVWEQEVHSEKGGE